ncbi:MAG: amidase family protein [Christensenellales bacterium]|jgi:aspartyl-tRNA(Asn)/glutamyl-tRNA(Gln) amidotransferase subunit A
MMRRYTISEARELLDSGKLSAAELTNYYLSRIEKLNPALNAYITVSKEQALNDARRAQEIIDSGASKPLTGIPFAISDEISTNDILTTCGSKMLYNYNPVFDATSVAGLKAQGAVILGKTNVDEFTLGCATKTSYFGPSLNPYNNKKLAGSGAAAAVSAGLAMCALVSDSSGEIRLASAYCGVSGLKPSYGAISRHGLISSASSLPQIGALSGNARDCALILDAVCGKDDADMTSVGYQSFTDAMGIDLKGKKVGVIKEYLEQASPEIVRAIENATEYFAAAGCVVEQVSLASAKYAPAAHYIISSAEASSNLARYDGIKFGLRSEKGDTYTENLRFTRAEGFGDEVKRRLLFGVHALSKGCYFEYFQKAELVRSKLIGEFSILFDNYDFLLAPAAKSVAVNSSDTSDPVKTGKGNSFTAENLAGLPCACGVCGYSEEGLPIGMQLIGKKRSDNILSAYAYAFEKVFGDKRKEAAE